MKKEGEGGVREVWWEREVEKNLSTKIKKVKEKREKKNVTEAKVLAKTSRATLLFLFPTLCVILEL